MTPTPAVLDTLLARVRAATGPDTRLDWDILDALFLADRNVSVFDLPRHLWAERRPGVAEAAAFTGSLDVAVALVKAVLPGAVWHVMTDYGGLKRAHIGPTGRPSASVYDCEDRPLFTQADGETPVLALCAALLTALLAQTTL